MFWPDNDKINKKSSTLKTEESNDPGNDRRFNLQNLSKALFQTCSPCYTRLQLEKNLEQVEYSDRNWMRNRASQNSVFLGLTSKLLFSDEKVKGD